MSSVYVTSRRRFLEPFHDMENPFFTRKLTTSQMFNSVFGNGIILSLGKKSISEGKVSEVNFRGKK